MWRRAKPPSVSDRIKSLGVVASLRLDISDELRADIEDVLRTGRVAFDSLEVTGESLLAEFRRTRAPS